VRPLWRRLLWAALALLLLLAVALWLLYRATQQVPEFYQQALGTSLPPTQLRAASDQLERQMLELHNDARRLGRWQAVFTVKQLNAWLAADLPQKFPQAMPAGARDPRVRITPQQIHFACSYATEHWQTVVSVTGEVRLTDTPNELAVRIREVRAGRVPIPLKRVLDEVSRQAQQRGLPLQWSQEQADPVALIQLPLRDAELPHREIHLESVTLRDGAIVVQGHTERTP
jgi:hypothetical protein